MNFEREYKKLNQRQREAVDLIDGPLVVIAGPGTGKTQLLSMRTANILKRTDVLPENILCLTFTEAAAENMRARLFQLTGKAANQVSVFTFHGFGTYIIQNYPEYFYDSPLLTQLNEIGEYDLLEKLMSRLHHDNPLARRVNDTFLHLPSVIKAISWFKQAGLQPDDLRIQALKDQSFFKATNKFLAKAFQSPASSKNIRDYENLLSSLKTTLQTNPSETGEDALDELEQAISSIDKSSRYAQSITGWRNKWLTQVKRGTWQFSDMQRNTFLIHLASLYESYQQSLAESGRYTFDDMILKTISAMENHEELKLTLQEKYQYILVDEYQDTNGAQDKILKLLADNPVNEGKPNLMVVGDDDQAIYRFQGAESSVMIDFIKTWTPKTVVLTDSYRSGQSLLDLARGVVINASDRLENSDSSLIKKLDSASQNPTTKIAEISSSNETDNYINTASSINKLIKSGTDPSSIAVLAPKHRYLEGLVPYMLKLDTPINYERREHILAQPRIIELLDLIDLVKAASTFKKSKIEALLPKILSADYWQLSANQLWKMALLAQQGQWDWLSVIEKSSNKQLSNFAAAIKLLAKISKNQSFELVLAYLIGSKPLQLDNNNFWSLPWRDYYFSEKQLEKDPQGYIGFMSQLEALSQAFREWHPGDQLATLDDFETFISLVKKTNIQLSDSSAYSSAKNSVQLMTVYKAKGLEWNNVFVLNAEEDVWGSRAKGRNQTFSLPSTLSWIQPANDNSNDLIKLFYVGITRARHQLYLTSYRFKLSGQPAERLIWLEQLLPAPAATIQPPIKIGIDSYSYDWQDVYKAPTKDLTTLLRPAIDSYKLSSTHLNDFLSVDIGGPKFFLYRHILKIPEELNPNAVYGDSIHKTLEFIHRELTNSSKLPDKKTINDFFVDSLRLKPLTQKEFKFFKKRGEDSLSNWLATNRNKFKETDISEHNFGGEQIILGEAKLTGKIDVIRNQDGNSLTVVDYKTSSPIASWKGLKATAAIRAHHYKQQLLFYKILAENSSYLRSKPKVTQGVIEFLSPDEHNEFYDLSYVYEEVEVDRLKNLINAVWQKIINLDLPDTSDYTPSIKGITTFEEDLLSGKI